jgi:hypothetical protein
LTATNPEQTPSHHQSCNNWSDEYHSFRESLLGSAHFNRIISFWWSEIALTGRD